jgi:ATP-binding cassette subfamily B protein
MSQGIDEQEVVERVEGVQLRPVDGLPATVAQRLDGEADGQAVLGWSEFDLDSQNRFVRQFVVLTDGRLIEIASDHRKVIELKDVQEARIVEGLGVDRLVVVVNDSLAAEMRYSRRHRATMTRLHRKLQRHIKPAKDGEQVDSRPDWLEAVEREAEKKEHCLKCGELIPSFAEGVCPRCAAQRKILWRLLDEAKPYKWRVRVTLALTITVSLMAALPGFLQKQLIDRAIDPSVYHGGAGVPWDVRERELAVWSILLLATIVISEWLNSIRLRVLALMGERITADLRHKIYSHMHELSLRYFSKRRTGSLITRVTNDTDRLWDFIVFGSIDLIRDVAMIVAIAGMMCAINWKLACVALLPLPVLGVLTYKRGMKMQKLFGRLWTYWSRMGAVVGDALPGVRVVKAFASEKKEISRFDRRSEEYSEKANEIHQVWTGLMPWVGGLMRFGSLLIWIIGGYLVMSHPGNPRYTLGTLVAFTGFVWQFYQPIMELANSNRMVTRAATSAQRIFEILDTPPDIYSRADAIVKPRLEGRVEFRNASFSYEGAQPALREVSMLAEPGQMIGLCGKSGAGKSTLVNLLCRFYDVTDGQILIDGMDIRDYDVKFLRRQIGMVLQEPYLFFGTIADNIRYGNAGASAEEVIAAAKAANAHDFIVSFPDGYDTMVGERGQSLSGGERQRVSIARAILHNPRILILDEATSSVDTETEREIQQALNRLVEGRTTFAIAHRLSTLTAADRLVVLESGKVVESGTHRELVDKDGGVYAKLFKTQLELNSQLALR